MKIKQITIPATFLTVAASLFYSFTGNSIKPGNDEEGKQLFKTYCQICHMLPDPKSLTKEIWRSHVLPVMASRMGIIYPGFDPLRGLSSEEKAIVNKNHIIPDEPFMQPDKWNKLVNYIVDSAPDSIPLDKSRLTRSSELKQFVRSDVELDKSRPSMITGIKYDTVTRNLWIGDYYNQAMVWKYGKGVVKTIKTNSPVVDFNFYKGDTYFTEIGKLYPTELNLGDYAKLNDTSVTKILAPLHRPVYSVMEDLNGDGVPEIITCNFGNKIGSLSLYHKNKKGVYTEEVLLPMPGAVKCYVKDMDGDGKKDIVAVFAQGDESVYIFYQKDNLKFRAKRVLRFPPNYGTTDLYLVDYNHDRLTDIVTVHGDNADFSDILKPYHGIRLHINTGKGTFQEKFFYPIYGATKVIADDFDKDGDIDFAVTSFFPDFHQLVHESFIYLENLDEKKYSFKPYTLKTGIPLKTLTLEEADIDGDGDMDLIAGHFAQTPGAVPADLNEKWKSAPYGLTIFYNQLHKGKK
jgi:hypothetical protein